MYLDVHEQLELVGKSKRSSHEGLSQRRQTYETFTSILSRSEICTMLSGHLTAARGKYGAGILKSRQWHNTMATMSEGQAGCTARESLALDRVRVNSSARHPVRVPVVLRAFVACRRYRGRNSADYATFSHESVVLARRVKRRHICV